MADRMSAEITIGGPVPRELVEQLCGEIQAAGVRLDYDGPYYEPHTAEDLLAACGEDGLLFMADHEVAYGEFTQLEDSLKQNNIGFTRRSEGKYEYDPLVYEFRPGRNSVEILTNNDFEPVIHARPVAEAEALLTEAVELLDDGDIIRKINRAQQRVAEAITTLQAALPPKLPPLEPLSIVDEPADQEQPPQEKSHGQ